MSYIVPIGPYHPALEEPIHAKLITEGELIRDAEVFVGYNHRGIEKLATERNAIQTLVLVERVCGICSHSHALTYAMAVEAINGVTVPKRGEYIRVITAELERLHSHFLWMGIACVVGAVFGSFGIQNIINYVTPIFLIMYPICIVLTVLGLLDKWIPNDGVYKFGVAVAGIVSVGDAILAVAPDLDGLRKVMYMIPLAEQGFSWLIPTVIAMVIGGIVYRGKPRYNYGETAVATEEAAK